MSADSLRQATRAELADHNDRVRRLARAYAPKYRPIVLILGYAENLDTGWSYLGIKTICEQTARYTASGKPLKERWVQQLMHEMQDPKAGALIVKERFSQTGRQRSSYRQLSHDVAVNQYGWGNPHDWDAPLEPETSLGTESEQPDYRSTAPLNAPITAPLTAPLELSLELPGNYLATTRARAQARGADAVAPLPEPKISDQDDVGRQEDVGDQEEKEIRKAASRLEVRLAHAWDDGERDRAQRAYENDLARIKRQYDPADDGSRLW